MNRLILMLGAVCAVVALAPGVARADDASLTGVVTKWSLKIAGPAQQLSTKVATAKTPDKALPFLRTFTKTASQGAAAIAKQRSSSAKGARLKLLSQRAFTNFANAGRLLISALNDVKAGKTGSTVTAKVNKAVKLATTGSAQLRNASRLIPQLVQ